MGQDMKIVVAHPMQQHSYHTAQAFGKRGRLDAYITTVYYDEHRWIYKLLSRMLGKDNVRRMCEKRLEDESIPVVRFCELLGLFYLLLIRIDKKKIILPRVYVWLTKRFGRKVFRYCEKNRIDALIMYDTTACTAFEKLSRRGCKTRRILDMSSIPAEDICGIIEGEIKRSGSCSNSMKLRLKTAKALRKRGETELKLADAVLCGSEFPQGVVLGRYPQKKTYVVPYGVNCEAFTPLADKKIGEVDPVRFLFVGGVEATKGYFYLKEAFASVPQNQAKLILVGDAGYSKNELEQQENVEIKGFVVRSKMPEVYRSADVYVIPSLYEGFSQSLIEAMSSGLPVIATYSSGASSVVRNSVNGFLVSSCDSTALSDRMNWFVQNRSEIVTMGKAARNAVTDYTWDHYEEILYETITEITNCG